MGSFVPPSTLVAGLLRNRRTSLGLTLRQVEEQARGMGDPIPITVIARTERGEIDPGFRRIQLLLRIYDLPPQLAADLADLEQFAGGALPDNAPGDFEEAVAAWKTGDVKKAVVSLLALQTQAADANAKARTERQRKLLSFAVAAAGLGKFRLSKHIVDELLLEPPEPELLARILTQAATCWLRLGSGEVALAFLAQAETHVAASDHQNKAWIGHGRASTLVYLRRFDEAESELERALLAYRACKDLHGEDRARGVLVNLQRDRGDLTGALTTAREAQAQAKKHGHERIRVMRRIDEGQLLIALGKVEEGITVLHDALVGAINLQDSVCQFHAHYNLWVAFTCVGDPQRADVELRTAQYFVRFLDETTPEAVTIRETLGPARPGRKERASEPAPPRKRSTPRRRRTT